MKKSIKKLLALTLTGAFLVGALTGCGKSGEDDKTITVAASATPHAEILEYAKDKLKEQVLVRMISGGFTRRPSMRRLPIAWGGRSHAFFVRKGWPWGQG